VSGSSFVLQQQYGLDEQQCGLAFGLGTVGLIGGTQLDVRLLRRATPGHVLQRALLLGVVAGMVQLATAATGAGGLAGVLGNDSLAMATVMLGTMAPALAVLLLARPEAVGAGV